MPWWRGAKVGRLADPLHAREVGNFMLWSIVLLREAEDEHQFSLGQSAVPGAVHGNKVWAVHGISYLYGMPHA